MSPPKQITREEMARLLDERCPTASPMVRHAALTGSVLKLANGEQFQTPDTFDYSKPSPCRIPAVVQKVGKQWINN